jgi:hypothetical protein
VKLTEQQIEGLRSMGKSAWRKGGRATIVAGAKMKTTRSKGKFFSEAIGTVIALPAFCPEGDEPGKDMDIV